MKSRAASGEKARAFHQRIISSLLAGAASASGKRVHDDIEVHAPAPLARRILLERLNELAHDGLRGNEGPEFVACPAAIHVGFERRSLEIGRASCRARG